jgi:hypothetical protein
MVEEATLVKETATVEGNMVAIGKLTFVKKMQ